MASLTGGGAIVGLAWSPDGKFLAAGNGSNTAQVWDTQTSRLVTTYSGHADAVTGIAWSPDGAKIASASADGTVQVWKAQTGEHLLTYDQKAPVWSVAWSPDGKTIASGSAAAGRHQPVEHNNAVKVWDATTGQTLLTYTRHGEGHQVYALTWTSNTQIVSGGDDGVIRIWDATTGETALIYNGHTNLVWSVAWSSKNQQIASSSQDATVRVWRPVAG